MSEGADQRTRQNMQTSRPLAVDSPQTRRLSGVVPITATGPVRIPEPYVPSQPISDAFHGKSSNQSTSAVNSECLAFSVPGQFQAPPTNVDACLYQESSTCRKHDLSNQRAIDPSSVIGSLTANASRAVIHSYGSDYTTAMSSRSLDSKPSQMLSHTDRYFGFAAPPVVLGTNKDANQVSFETHQLLQLINN